METRDQELWACAIWVENHHGASDSDYIGKQLRRLSLEGDLAGVTTWRAIAKRYDTLVDGVAVSVRQ